MYPQVPAIPISILSTAGHHTTNCVDMQYVELTFKSCARCIRDWRIDFTLLFDAKRFIPERNIFYPDIPIAPVTPAAE
jgi:hypothetical protein